jgi:capsular exopolysaccharide synthesis family protein
MSPHQGVPMKAYTLEYTESPKLISLRRLTYLLGRNWHMLAVVISITLVGAYVLGRLLPPLYRATTTIQVLSAGAEEPDEDEGMFLALQGQTAASLVTIRTNMAVVRDRLGLNTDVATLTKQVDVAWNAESEQIEIAVEYNDPNQAAAIANMVADMLLEQNAARNGDAFVLTQIGAAAPPQASRRPWLLYNLIGAGTIGLLAGGAVVLAKETTDNTIRTPYDIVPRTGLRLLGIITPIDSALSSPVVVAAPHSPAASAFRSLYSAIKEIGEDRPINTLMVTSPTPQEGKSTVATNLAAVMALAGQRVLLIDADLRLPTLHKKLSISNEAGVSNLYNRPLGHLSQLVKPTPMPGLDVLTAGPIQPNPARLLDSERILQILYCAQRQYEVVVVDSPPILAVADALILARHVDGVLFVVRAGKTTQQAGKQALAQIRQLDAELIGVVLNDLKLKEARLWHSLHGEFVAPPASSLPSWRDRQRQSSKPPSYEVVRRARQAAYLEALNRTDSEFEQRRIIVEMKEAHLLRGMNLWAADLSGIRLPYADLRETNLGMANLQGASLAGVDLRNASLGVANLQMADLRSASLSDASLGYIDLQDADLSEADLTCANLAHANLKGTNLRYANLSGAVLDNAELDRHTCLPDGMYWASDVDMARFTNPKHPDFWHIGQVAELSPPDFTPD